MVIWITGVSGAGKTTLSSSLQRLLKKFLPQLIIVDGDIVRQMFGGDLDYSEASRTKQIQRIQHLAKWLEEQSCIVIVAALYAHPNLLKWNRENFKSYFEVYIEAPMELLRKRDSKGLYRSSADRQVRNVVGIDIPWHAPQNPDLTIDAKLETNPDDLARRVIARIPSLAAVIA